MIRQQLLVILAFTLGAAMSAGAQEIRLPPPNWDRHQAILAAQSINLDDDVEILFGRAARGEGQSLLSDLELLGRQAGAPAHESALMQFTQKLHALPSGSVQNELMDWLKSRQAETLIAHDDHPSIGVPMFNIPAAAHGVENGWLQQDSRFEAGHLLRTEPAGLVRAFNQATERPVRAGYLASLDDASFEQLQSVLETALPNLEDTPQLTGLAGKSALLSGDLAALETTLIHGSGDGLTHTMQAAARTLSVSESEHLLTNILQSAPPATAAMAIAELATDERGVVRFEGLLLDLLGEPATGAAAALALSRSQNPDTRAEIEAMALSADGSLASKRAKLVLQLSNAGVLREASS
jgi:hypothetical protein